MRRPHICAVEDGTGKTSFDFRRAEQLAEKIILRGRARAQQDARSAIAERQSKIYEFPSVREICEEKDINKAKITFSELYRLNTSIENLIISQEAQLNEIARIEHKTGPLFSLSEKIFYAIKAIVAEKEGIENPWSFIIVREKLKREYLLRVTVENIKEAFREACQTPDERRAFLDELLKEISSEIEPTDANASQATQLDKPKSVPHSAELWANRPNKRGESPAAWIQRVYAAELEAGTLTRAALREADLPLYQAYATWIRRHPDDDLALPAQPRTNLDTVSNLAEHIRARTRAFRARQRAT